ncbi:MAG: sodium:calcium antiporter [Planctomycetota bacterium]|nr:sodium:calcium antiporter [Planctomycetota bacterium]
MELLPETLFHGWSMSALLGIVAVTLFAVAKGADWLVDGATALALRFGVSKVVVGATVVSLGTTMPEAAVSVMAAWSGKPGLAIGNAVGSIVADTGLIFGLGCLLSTLPADRWLLSRQGWVQFGSAAALAGFCYAAFWVDGDAAALTRTVGIVFLAGLLAYLIASIRWSYQRHGGPATDDPEPAPGSFRRRIAFATVGVAIVLLASRILILAASELAETHWNVPKVVVAGTLVAMGTSLPELVIGMTAVLKGQGELLVGNVIGADVLNVLFVVGASAVAAPLPIVETGSTYPRVALIVHLPAMMAILLLFRIFIACSGRRGAFRRIYGIPLIAIYVAYVLLQFQGG